MKKIRLEDYNPSMGILIDVQHPEDFKKPKVFLGTEGVTAPFVPLLCPEFEANGNHNFAQIRAKAPIFSRVF